MAALTALLRRGATTYALTVTDALTLPSLEADVSIIGGTGTALPRLVVESMGAPTRLTVPIMLEKTSQPALQAEVDAIDAFLRLGECTLEITFTDAAAATIWTVYHAQPLQPPFTPSADLAYWVEASLTLVVSPFNASAAVTLYSAEPVTAPDSLVADGHDRQLPLAADHRGRRDRRGHALAVPGPRRLRLRRLPRRRRGPHLGRGRDRHRRRGCAHRRRRLRGLPDRRRRRPLDTADYPEGPYLILARVKVLGGETGYVTTDFTDDVISFTRATWHTVELGTCYLPTRQVRGAAAANLTASVYGSSAAGGDEACIDWVYPLPLGGGMFAWHPETATVSATTILRDADTGRTYADDVANEQHVTGGTLTTLGGRLLIVSEAVAGTDPTHAVAVTVSHTPRFAWMR